MSSLRAAPFSWEAIHSSSTSPAIRQGSFSGSKRRTTSIPERPSRAASNVEATFPPRGVIAPYPVITTLLSLPAIPMFSR